jgi:hypothetical protein
VPSVSLLALDKIPKSILCRMPAAGHSAKYLNPFFAECQIVGTRQSIFKKKIFAECRIAGTRQRTLTYPAEPLPHSSPPLCLARAAIALSSPCPRRRRSLPSPPLLARTAAAPSPCPPMPRPATAGRTLPRHCPRPPPPLPAPFTAGRTLPRRPHPPSPCPAIARTLARHRTHLQSRFHLEFSEFYIVICDLVITILYYVCIMNLVGLVSSLCVFIKFILHVY